MREDTIVIKGARQHNLKDIDLEIPKGRLVVLTGVSGSGKSSLAFDTIYAEGQRRYVESLSAYARQFLERMDKPDVDFIEGLSPAIAIEQKGLSRNPRSTVGTVTEIYDYLRLLFARVGHPHCYICGREIRSQTPQQMVDQLLTLPEGSRLVVIAPLVQGRKGEYRKLLDQLRGEGFIRVRIDGEIKDLSEEIALDKNKRHDIDLVVDRIVMRAGAKNRITESVELALRYGEGLVKVTADEGEELVFSERFSCLECGVSYPELSPRLFSFNSPYGACQRCSGLGFLPSWEHPVSNEFPTFEATEEEVGTAPCPVCGGARLRREALHVRFQGRSITEITQLSIQDALAFFGGVTLTPQEEEIAKLVLREIRERLSFLVRVGLTYLSLDRTAATLSGGEGERIRLATQIGSGLTGVLYVLDEPSIGLHLRDNLRLLDTLKQLRDLGNTVIVVEHDPQTVLSADHVIDMGPGAGVHGGAIVFAGTPQALMKDKESLTGQYLSHRLTIPIPAQRRKSEKGSLVIKGAKANNLKGITVAIPYGVFTCVTGVSGSGKSTLVIDTLHRALAQELHSARELPGEFTALQGTEGVDKVVKIDQMPIGRTSRSNPATYTGVFTIIRDLFVQLPESRVRGYPQGRFSFNVKGGRCEACQGEGIIRIEMHFLPDVYVTCDECKGMRFNRETLEIRYKGRDIAEVLKMTVEEALEFFRHIPPLKKRLGILDDVGLGYIQLGQPAPTLSGGEAQRVKLARELGKRDTGRTVYILDEPTTGLHFAEIQRLLDVLNRLVDAGNTVIVIEHNLDVIKSADYIIDLGPEGGDAGGEVITMGTPEEVAACAHSYTGGFLKKALS
ncbi:MAG: excinuclease ABC subunit UvrA [Deltaproteobacteria bacterium]|nr:excinuclease ABC subunit UvrA [Deltaproteobacteria bacterium]